MFAATVGLQKLHCLPISDVPHVAGAEGPRNCHPQVVSLQDFKAKNGGDAAAKMRNECLDVWFRYYVFFDVGRSVFYRPSLKESSILS